MMFSHKQIVGLLCHGGFMADDNGLKFPISVEAARVVGGWEVTGKVLVEAGFTGIFNESTPYFFMESEVVHDGFNEQDELDIILIETLFSGRSPLEAAKTLSVLNLAWIALSSESVKGNTDEERQSNVWAVMSEHIGESLGSEWSRALVAEIRESFDKVIRH